MGRRFFRYGELHLVILSLLSRRAMHGYELMGEMADLFGPMYRPSGGSVYPAVESLEAEGLIEATAEDGRRTYRLTRTGRASLRRRASAVSALEVRTGVHLSRDHDADAALARFSSRVRGAAARIDPDSLAHVLDRAADEIDALAPPCDRPGEGAHHDHR